MIALIPLQQPILFSGVELTILLIVEIIVAAFVGRWIYYNAQSRGSKWAWQWSVGIAILLVFLFVLGWLSLYSIFSHVERNGTRAGHPSKSS